MDKIKHMVFNLYSVYQFLYSVTGNIFHLYHDDKFQITLKAGAFITESSSLHANLKSKSLTVVLNHPFVYSQ